MIDNNKYAENLTPPLVGWGVNPVKALQHE
jgi:hypothetical protein